MNGIIYLAKNKINNKVYVGKTFNFFHRKSDHIYKSLNNCGIEYNYYFHRAIRKYGINNFEWNILQEGINNKEDLCWHEIWWISQFDASNSQKGYNLTTGGDGCIHNEFSRKKISMALKNRPKSEEHKRKISNTLKNHIVPETTKQNLSNALMGKPKSTQHKNNISAARMLKFSDPKERQKLAISLGSKLFDVFKKITKEYVGSWINQSECARDLMCNVSHICDCLCEKRKSHNGYIFMVRKENDGQPI